MQTERIKPGKPKQIILTTYTATGKARKSIIITNP